MGISGGVRGLPEYSNPLPSAAEDVASADVASTAGETPAPAVRRQGAEGGASAVHGDLTPEQAAYLEKLSERGIFGEPSLEHEVAYRWALKYEGDTPRAKEVFEKVSSLVNTSVFDWSVSGSEKREAADLMKSLSANEFFRVVEDLQKEAKYQPFSLHVRRSLSAWLFKPEFKPLVEAKTAEFQKGIRETNWSAGAKEYASRELEQNIEFLWKY